MKKTIKNRPKSLKIAKKWQNLVVPVLFAKHATGTYIGAWIPAAKLSAGMTFFFI
jgi:hypothetical protein